MEFINNYAKIDGSDHDDVMSAGGDEKIIQILVLLMTK